mgnify:CR=1 FL=1
MINKGYDKLNEQQMRAILMRYVSNSLEGINKTFAAYYKSDYDLTTNQMSTIWYLKYCGMMTMGEFANKMQMSRQQATQLINHLVETDYVKRQYSKENRRIIYIKVAEKGERVIDEIESKYSKHAFEEIQRLSIEDQARFVEAMEVLSELLPQVDFGPKR